MLKFKKIYFFVMMCLLSLIFYISVNASVWMHIAKDFAVKKVLVHPKDPSLIYITVEGQGIFSTTNGGVSWQKLVTKIEEGVYQSPVSIALHPNNTQILYGIARVKSALLPFKSKDSGESWEGIWHDFEIELMGLINKASFRAIAVDPNAPETIYIGDATGPPVMGIYVSHDGGLSWKFADSEEGNGASFFAISPIDSTVYAVIPKSPGAFIRKSSDRGKSWKTIFGNVEGVVSAIAINPKTGDLYVHGTDSHLHTGMYFSRDKGESWESIDNGFPIVSDGLDDSRSTISALAVDAHTNTIYAATRVGVYRSQNTGKSWEPFNEGLTNLNIHCIALNPIDSSIYAGTDNGLFKAELAHETFVNFKDKMPTTLGKIKEKKHYNH